MKVKTFLLTAFAGVTLIAVGCSDDTNKTTNSGSSGTSSGAGGEGGAGATMPNLGTQIDRKGRPAINTAANNTFEGDAMKADMGKNAWNANSNPATWTSYVAEIQANIAILDSLDTMCGTQLLVDTTKTDPSRYAKLAGVLADDRLYVRLDGAMCTTYLGVEADAVGVTNTDCGGRTLAYDVIDASYTVLATGALDGSVGDGVPISDAAKGTTFPYLAAPH